MRNHSRRSFLKLAGSAVAVGAFYHPVLADHYSISRLFSKDEREAYALRLLTELCGLGPRATGTTQYAQGISIIKNELDRFLPLVHYEEYKFEQWELVGEPEFFIGNQYIETYPATGSPGTPSAGLTGILEKNESGFLLKDPSTQQHQAFIGVNSLGRATPVYYRGPARGQRIPLFGIGKQDRPLIERAIRQQEIARLNAQVRFLPNSKGMNAVGQIPGRTTDEILFVAHADTVYNSPGAIDNTASVIVMLMLAKALIGREPKHTITFLATDGEEYNYLGATHYAKQRLADRTIKNIKHIINFDSFAWGPNLWFNSFDDGVKSMLRSIHSDLNINSTPIFKESDGFVMDSSPFRPSEARALHVNSRGYDEKTLPLYHRPDDVARHVPLDCLEIAFQVFNEYIKRIDKG